MDLCPVAYLLFKSKLFYAISVDKFYSTNVKECTCEYFQKIMK